MFKQPLAKRKQRSERWRQRYRSDPDFRLQWLNKKRVSAGKEPFTSLPPVGQVRPAWAASRQRDERGRFA